jgi:hypothetical protein
MTVASPETITIHPPLAGEWKFLRPPGHHAYAFDFVQMDDKRKSYHDAAKIRFLVHHIAANRFFCWDQPVFAPIDGEVIRVGNGWKDHASTSIWKTIRLWYNATYRFRPKEENGRLDIRPNAGNHVMIQAKDGCIVFLAHLRDQSIAVMEGAQVRQGEVIGRVGNSGNSTMPHLHLNLFDQMDDPFKAEVLPFVFARYETLTSDGQWIENTSSLPKPGVCVRFRA